MRDVPSTIELEERVIFEQTLFSFCGGWVAVDRTAGVEEGPRDGDDGVGRGEGAEELAGCDSLAGLGDCHVGDRFGDDEGLGDDVWLGGCVDGVCA